MYLPNAWSRVQRYWSCHYRIAIQEHASTAVDGWAQSSQHLFADEQIFESAVQVSGFGVLALDRLQLDCLAILFQLNWGGTVVGGAQRIAPRADRDLDRSASECNR